MIKAIEYIETGFSSDDAIKLDTVIQPMIQSDDKIIVDFTGIKIFTTLFFNNVFAKYILQIGPENYKNKFELTNLSELGETTYQHSFDNALNYYNLSVDKKESNAKILENPED